MTGDDLMEGATELVHAVTGETMAQRAVTPLTANAYLGGWGIARALAEGADVVVTGRVADASLVVGPAAWHFGWERARLEPAGGGGGGGPRHRVRGPGHRRELQLLHRGAGPRRGRLPHRRGRGGRVGDHHQAPRHRGDGHGGDGHRPAALRGGRAPVPQSRRRRPGSTRSSWKRSGPTGCGSAGCSGSRPPPTTKVAATVVAGYRNAVTFVIPGLDVEAKAAVALAAVVEESRPAGVVRIGRRAPGAHRPAGSAD